MKKNWKLLPFLATFANFGIFVPFTVSIITKPPTMTEKYKLPDKYVEKNHMQSIFLLRYSVGMIIPWICNIQNH